MPVLMTRQGDVALATEVASGLIESGKSQASVELMRRVLGGASNGTAEAVVVLARGLERLGRLEVRLGSLSCLVRVVGVVVMIMMMMLMMLVLQEAIDVLVSSSSSSLACSSQEGQDAASPILLAHLYYLTAR